MSADGDASPVVELTRLRKRFGWREVLRGVDFRLGAASCAAVFGANGAGKSTLLRVVSTEFRPTGGEGRVVGVSLAGDLREARRRIGVVSHRSFLRPEFSLEENLRFFADLQECRLDDRADALIERIGLGSRRRDRVGTYSQGMTKRADIVRSLLHRPTLWLLDEPFSGLDPEGRRLFADMIRDFVTAGGSALVVTHQVDLGLELADEAYVVEDGRLVPYGAATVAEGGAR